MRGYLVLIGTNYGGPEVQITTANQKTQQQIKKDNNKREITVTLTKPEKEKYPQVT